MNLKTIKKTQEFLNDVNNKLNGRTPITSSELQQLGLKHKCAHISFYRAVELGFISKVSPSIYKSNLVVFEPIHARKVVELRNIKQIENKNKRTLEPKPTKAMKMDKMPKLPKFKEKPVKIKQLQVKSKKSMSIFWGLFKISY